MKIRSNECGFTLTEILVSVSLIAIAGVILVPLYQSFEQKNQLDLVTLSLAQNFRRSQILAQSVSGDSSWGVKIGTTTATIFKGSSFITRDPSFDETYEFSPTITATGTSEIIFSKLYGLPQPTGTLTLTNSNLDSRNLLIGEKGTITF